MRTTVTLDDDLTRHLKRRVPELGVPFEEDVDRAIRAGLECGTPASPAPKIVPHSFGFRPGVDLDNPGELADEWEAEA
jgi:hypothetical protein